MTEECLKCSYATYDCQSSGACRKRWFLDRLDRDLKRMNRRKIMAEYLPDTNVGNIEYIRKQDAVEALDGKIIVTGHENADAVLQYMKDITNKIKSLEPVDVAPVVQGRWIKYTGMGKVQWMCSECSAEEKNPKVANYCYHCGAKMDAQREE